MWFPVECNIEGVWRFSLRIPRLVLKGFRDAVSILLSMCESAAVMMFVVAAMTFVLMLFINFLWSKLFAGPFGFLKLSVHSPSGFGFSKGSW